MTDAFDVRTSKSLLLKLRVFEDGRTWQRFLGLYLPMVQVWGRRLSLPETDIDELTSRLLLKFVTVLPQFNYDPDKGSFRGWLKTVVVHEIANLARERQRRAAATGDSAVYELLLAQADKADDLVAGLGDRSEGLLQCVDDALTEIQAGCQGGEQNSWQAFRRIFLEEAAVAPLAAEYGWTYHAAVQRVHRIKIKVKARIEQLAVQRGLIDRNPD
jgi:DNA-directed RNA polymerase specialized sigma24 family protein